MVKKIPDNFIVILIGIINHDILSNQPKILLQFDRDYKQILDEIYESDICISKGRRDIGGGNFFEILSLGKMWIYIVAGDVAKFDANKTLLHCDKFLIKDIDSYEVVEDKMSKLLSAPKKYFDKMREPWLDFSYPYWNKIVGDLLEKYK